MKSILVYFEDKEHDSLIERKGKMSWHDFILQLIKKGKGRECEII